MLCVEVAQAEICYSIVSLEEFQRIDILVIVILQAQAQSVINISCTKRIVGTDKLPVELEEIDLFCAEPLASLIHISTHGLARHRHWMKHAIFGRSKHRVCIRTGIPVSPLR